MSVLNALAEHPDGLDIVGVARLTELDKSTAYRFLSSLVKVGAVRQEPTGRFRLSWKMFEIGSTLLLSQGIDFKRVYPPLEELSASTGQSTNMAIIDGNEVVIVATVNSQGIIQTVFRMGARLPLYCTALGKAVLAHMDAAALRRYLDSVELTPNTEHTLVNKDALMNDLRTTRERGFSFNNEEYCLGIYCIASPVFNFFDEPFATVGASGHSDRFILTPSMGREIIRVARLFSEYYGARPERLAYFDDCLLKLDSRA
jgi:DNA-binding IclR family transcriptional regulator